MIGGDGRKAVRANVRKKTAMSSFLFRKEGVLRVMNGRCVSGAICTT